MTNKRPVIPVITIKPDGTRLFFAWYDRRNNPNNGLMDVYGRWATIAANGTVTLGTEFKITTESFPPVFAGTLLENEVIGHYDPVWPPAGVNLHWWYPVWPAPLDPPASQFPTTTDQYIGHVGEYNGAWVDGPYVYVSWTDYRKAAPGSRYPRLQSDIRFVRLMWP